MNRILKPLAGLGLIASLALTGAPSQAAAVAGPDAKTSINSAAPVAGLMTVGGFTVSNVGTESIPSRARFIIRFEDMNGQPSKSQHNVACTNIFKCRVTRVPNDNNAFIITAWNSLDAGKSFSGTWSNSHFLNGTRDRVIIEPLDENIYNDVDTSNDKAMYDNHGLGF